VAEGVADVPSLGGRGGAEIGVRDDAAQVVLLGSQVVEQRA